MITEIIIRIITHKIYNALAPLISNEVSSMIEIFEEITVSNNMLMINFAIFLFFPIYIGSSSSGTCRKSDL